MNGRDEEARTIFERTGEPDALAVIQAEHQLEHHGLKEKLFGGNTYRKPIIYAVLLAMFNQLSGINAILYYAPRILKWLALIKQRRTCNPCT